MITLDLTTIEFKKLITHHIGNKLRDEKCSFSNELSIIERDTKDLLLKYFLLPIKTESFYSFSHSITLELNEVFTIAKKIFSNTNDFVQSSQDIGKLLYEQSMHPKIKEGQLNVSFFTKVILDGETMDAIGIFKSETSVPYIKMVNKNDNFIINHDYGFEIKGMDKGCIIFNTDSDNGYKLLILDNTNRGSETRYWVDDFLKVKTINSEFQQTNEFLGIAKQFVTKQLTSEFEVTKADQIDLLNRSVEYFKSHETFKKSEFEEVVFHHPEFIESFKKFDQNYRYENEVELDDNFEISSQAVKKQAKVFKRVLKLDKNFDIHIHGDRRLLEQGVDENGRKFYKIYYEYES